MIPPVSRVNNLQDHEVSHQPARPQQPHQPAPKSGALSRDQVTLRSAGELDHDPDQD
jgi:hypothetical protein